MNRAVFLDRDGTLNALVHYADTGEYESPRSPADFRLLLGVIEALAALQAGGGLLFVVSNQPSYAKGKTSLSNLQAVHSALDEALQAGGVRLREAYYCYHHPRGVVPDYTGACGCRKPGAASLFRARDVYDLDLGACWMIGDQATDVECARAAGCRSLLLDYAPSADKRGGLLPDCRDLTEAVAVVMREVNHAY